MSLQDVVNSLSDGSVYTVPTGSYSGGVNFGTRKSITLQAQEGVIYEGGRFVGGSQITLHGGLFNSLGGGYQQGGIQLGKGSTITGVSVVDATALAVNLDTSSALTRSRVLRAGYLGVSCINGPMVARVMVANCEIAFCNRGMNSMPVPAGDGRWLTVAGKVFGSPSWEAGGIKFCSSSATQPEQLAPVIENNWIHDNGGNGIWLDVAVRGAIIRHNLIEKQRNITGRSSDAWTAAGIAIEICNADNAVEDNLIRGNDGAEIYLMETEGVSVMRNYCDGGIAFRDGFTENGLPKRQGWLKNITIKDNWSALPQVLSGRNIVAVGNKSYFFPTSAQWATPETGPTNNTTLPPVPGPVATRIVGADKFGTVWTVDSTGNLYRDGLIMGAGAGVLDAFLLLGFFWQKTQYGFHRWGGTAWEMVTSIDPRGAIAVEPDYKQLYEAAKKDVSDYKETVATLNADLQRAIKQVYDKRIVKGTITIQYNDGTQVKL